MYIILDVVVWATVEPHLCHFWGVEGEVLNLIFKENVSVLCNTLSNILLLYCIFISMTTMILVI